MERLIELLLEWYDGSLVAFTLSSVTAGSTAVELVVPLGKGAIGDFSAGEGEAEALEDTLAVLEEILDPFPTPS